MIVGEHVRTSAISPGEVCSVLLSISEDTAVEYHDEQVYLEDCLDVPFKFFNCTTQYPSQKHTIRTFRPDQIPRISRTP